jgi:hypothetical protein
MIGRNELPVTTSREFREFRDRLQNAVISLNVESTPIIKRILHVLFYDGTSKLLEGIYEMRKKKPRRRDCV